MATGNLTVSATGDQDIDGLLGGVKWNSNAITYNFPTVATYYTANGPYGGSYDQPSGFLAVSESFKNMARSAFAEFARYAPLTFTEATATDQSANISVGRTSIMGGFNGFGYYPGALQRSGDIWFNSSTTAVGDVEIHGRGTWRLVLHELGHAMGLKHPHEGGGAADTTMTAEHDYNDFTVMSYKRVVNGPTSGTDQETFGNPQTLMMYDIATLQAMYGANFTTESGATTYQWSPTTGAMSINGVAQTPPGSNRIYMTLWDGGGVDAYDLSNYTTNLTVDLAPGAYSVFSDIQLARTDISDGTKALGNVFNALQYNGDARSLIENATGGTGDDALRGNATGNALSGGGGDDAIEGREGSDTLDGGAGADAMDGGAGIDTATYAAATAGVTANLDLGIGASGDAQGDTYANIENLLGTIFDDVLVGKPGVANTLDGGVGNDTIYGEGADTISGGQGLDVFFGGQGGAININLAAASIETIWGSVVGDVFSGAPATAPLVMIGAGGADTMTGGSGADFLYFDSLDAINGGGGSDWAVATLSAAGVVLDMASTQVENAWGSPFADMISAASAVTSVSIIGDIGNDTLTGGSAADFIYGFGDDDTIRGAGGNDQLSGNAGADRFIYNSAPATWGVDTIWDFTRGSDRINLAGSGFTSFAQLTIQNSGAHSIVAGGGGGAIWVLNNATLDASDFLFA